MSEPAAPGTGAAAVGRVARQAPAGRAASVARGAAHRRASLRRTLYRIQRTRLVGLAVAGVLCLAGWTVVALLPNRYSATADIYVAWSPALATLLGLPRDTPGTAPRVRAVLTRMPTLSRLLLRLDPEAAAAPPAEFARRVAAIGEGLTVTSLDEHLYRLTYLSPPDLSRPKRGSGSIATAENGDAARARTSLAMLINLFVEENVRFDRDSIAAARAFLDARIAEKTAAISRAAMGAAAPVQARRAAVLRAQREELTRSRAALGDSVAISPAANQVQFQLVRPPTGPARPAGPDRPLLFTAVLAAAATLGLLASLLAAATRPTFVAPAELADAFALPVIASISQVPDEQGRRRERGRRRLFLFGAVLLAGAYLLLLALAQFTPDLFG